MTWIVRRRSAKGRLLQAVLPTATLLVGLALPFALTPYRVYQLTVVIVWAIAALGLNLVTGWAGQISLGHSAFFALGAYTTAILVHDYDWPHMATLAPSLGLGLLMGLVVGIPTLRLKGLYLGIVSIALAMMVVPVLIRFKDTTGGAEGLALPKLAAPDVVDYDQWVYLVCLGVAAVLFGIAALVVKSGIGRALMAIRDNETAAASVGVNIPRYKILIFGMSAAYTSVAGSLYAIVVEFVSPPSFSLFLSISFLAAIVVGGLGRLYGAVIGALFVHYAPLVASSIGESSGTLFYGAALIIVMAFAPGGAMSILERVTGRVVRLTESDPTDASPAPKLSAAHGIHPPDDLQLQQPTTAQPAQRGSK